MSKNIIQSIVIILAILIFIAFLALIYGMYLKISIPSYNLEKSSYIYSLKLDKNEKIKNIEVIDKDNLLIVIDQGDDIKGSIYNIKENEVIRFINR